jgi:signal transduction histidine kinase
VLRRLSLRWRITIVTFLVFGATLSGLSFLLVHSLEGHMDSQLDAQLGGDIDTILLRLQQGRSPVGGPTDRIAQVVAPDGGLLRESTDPDRNRPLLAEPLPWTTNGSPGPKTVTNPTLGTVRVRYEAMRSGSGNYLVVARPRDQIEDAVGSVTRSLGLIVPFVTFGLALVVWVVVGRALRPVESLRVSLDEITSDDISMRVEVPPQRDEIGRLACTMNDLLERLDASAQRERRLVADLSHELRSPLAVARALVETQHLAENANDPAETLAALNRLQAVVDQILDLATYEEHQLAPLRPIDLDDVVLRHAHLLRRTSDLTVDTSGVSGGQVLGIDEALGRMIENLTSNARRHARSRVAYSVSERDDRVELIVSDDGAGIPIADRGRVFERFTRLDEARELDRTGAGLGLAIVAEIVDRHSGTIEIEDHDSAVGTCFVVRLPAAG